MRKRLLGDFGMARPGVRWGHTQIQNYGCTLRVSCAHVGCRLFLLGFVRRFFLMLVFGWISLCYAFAESPNVLEISKGWQLASANKVTESGKIISGQSYSTASWYPIRRMPATVLEILEEDGIYPNLYYGMNLLTKVPQDLYKQDWWYRTTFTAPANRTTYWLSLPGINYRAEIWLNGKRLADSSQISGMYAAHELNVTDTIRPGEMNTLAIRVTPEQKVQDVNGVELADSWFDWINVKYLGYKGPLKNADHEVSFVPDRNAGVWKPVSLRSTGALKLSNPLVNTDLPLPRTDSATLTVFANVTNGTAQPVEGRVVGEILLHGRPSIHLEQSVLLKAGETREVSFDPDRFPQLRVMHPELWWPYTMGKPNLYDLHMKVLVGDLASDTESIRFGIRKITQHRDQDHEFPNVGKGGNFYLQVNGKNFLIRGAVYTPDLLYRYDPDREAAQLHYVKDMGLNMLRWESKISSEHIIELADEEGIPLMFGWMCCNQWEKWNQWDAEDHRVAEESLRSQILMLRSHAAVFIWANGSDGLAPEPVRSTYHKILQNLNWQNATVDTVSSFARAPNGDRLWDGIHMEGPYSWRPPSYWFAGRYAAARGACAEQGDNENVPAFESLKKFIPANALWPIGENWYFHGGSHQGNSELLNTQNAVDRRYGPSKNAEEFSQKAQLGLYEDTRAQFEDFAANGWANHKMTLYWMLNSPWPSFFGQLFDYYLKQGGAYYGAKKGLRPLSVVFDYYATGDHTHANISIVNQTLTSRHDLRVRIRIYDLMGNVRYDKQSNNLSVDAQGVMQALSLPLLRNLTSTYFVRCELFDGAERRLVDNVYWQSTTRDDVGDPSNDSAFDLKQASWADMTALNTMPQVPLQIHPKFVGSAASGNVDVVLHNTTRHIAFFERVEITDGKDGNEILPITYNDNYVTVFPGETVTIHANFSNSNLKVMHPWLRLQGVDTMKELAPIER